MLLGLGATSPLTQADCPVGGSWEAWCDCMWPAGADPATNGKCRSKPLSFATPAPWTIAGANARGIPHGSGLTLPVGTVVDPGAGAPPPSPVASTLLGLPKMAVYAGAGVLAVGLLSTVLFRRKRA